MFSLSLYVKSRNQPQQPLTALEKGDARVKDLVLLTLALAAGGMALMAAGGGSQALGSQALRGAGMAAWFGSFPMVFVTLFMREIQIDKRHESRKEKLPTGTPLTERK